jgi:hypothetical protein
MTSSFDASISGETTTPSISTRMPLAHAAGILKRIAGHGPDGTE